MTTRFYDKVCATGAHIKNPLLYTLITLMTIIASVTAQANFKKDHLEKAQINFNGTWLQNYLPIDQFKPLPKQITKRG